MLALFADVDAILAPATPCTAPAIGQQTFMLDGVELNVRANLGIYTQPISFIGLPVVAVPVPLDSPADRRADHRGAVARGHRVAHRACARTGRRGRRDQTVARAGQARAHAQMSKPMDIDLPDVVAEVTAAFERYERALMANDVATLNALFRDDPRTIRYGGGENLYGHAEISSFRAARSPLGLARTLSKTVITTYGRDVAVASTLFHRAASPRQGRPPDADLGPVCGRLARRGGACEHDRRRRSRRTSR